jgi:hypothetical protein
MKPTTKGKGQSYRCVRGFKSRFPVGILSAIKMPESYLKMPGVQGFGKYRNFLNKRSDKNFLGLLRTVTRLRKKQVYDPAIFSGPDLFRIT